MFLCDELVTVIRVLALTRGSNKSARNKDNGAKSIQILSWYILNHSKLRGSKRMCKPTHLNDACTIFGGSMKGVDRQKD